MTQSPWDIATQIAQNAWAISWFGDGIESSQHVPSETLYREPHSHVERVAATADQGGNPVLLVTPLAVPVHCWDLRPGQSLAAHLSGYVGAGTGRPTYTIDYGRITFADRAMGFEDWVGDILPTAIRRISTAHGGAKVHLVGWSHGGTISLLTAAHAPELPIASITALGTPSDYSRMPTYAGLRWLNEKVGTAPITFPTALVGGTPEIFTRLGYRALAPMRELTKPWSLISNLHRPEILGRIEAVDDFIAAMPGYPGRFFHQSLTKLVLGNDLMKGRVQLREDFVVEMAQLRANLLLIGSTTDVLAAAPAVAAGWRAYPNAMVDYAEFEGLSHLGLVASPRAATTTWPRIDEYLRRHDDLVERQEQRAQEGQQLMEVHA